MQNRAVYILVSMALGGLLDIRPIRGDSPAEPPRVTLYAAEVRPGEAWRQAEARGEQPDLSRHREYSAELRRRGKIVMAGPFADGSGGLIILRAESLEEAKSLLEKDPAVVEGVFTTELRPWLVQAGDLERR
ncbi:MAG: YciI family protein [Phycisphaerae bacterium]|nr:YciI family protein [Phycisphaerae bacterium]MDW8261799.1 YciI family protein [Phycisphaerales bacterium]